MKKSFKPPTDPETQRLLKDPEKSRSYWRGVRQVEDALRKRKGNARP